MRELEMLGSAIEGLSETFAVWDVEDRLLVCNERFRELGRPMLEITRPGTLFRDHIRAILDAGLVPRAKGREEEWFEERLRRHRDPGPAFEVERQDSRWILIKEQRLPDGLTVTISSDITERKRSEEALRESEQRYRHIFDYSAVATSVSAPSPDTGELRVVRGNAAFCTMLGYAEDELGNLSLADLTHPDDRAAAVELAQRMIDGELENFQLDRRLIHRSGIPIWVKSAVTAVRDAEGRYAYAIGQHQDISELKRTEEALRFSDAQFRDYAESAADWFWEMDAELRFTYMSDNVERLVSVRPEWHYGKTREELLGEDYDRETWAAHLEDLRERRPFRNFEYLRKGSDEVEPKWLRVSGVPRFAEDGTFLGYRGSGTDITEQKLAEERLRESETRLRHAQRLEAVGQLTGGVAHDFNNLLAVILGNAELFAEDLGGTNAYLEAILRASARGAELTQRLLAFSRQQPLDPRPFDPARLTREMSGLLARALGETVEVEVAAEEGLWPALADPGQVENALLNLAINARDAMPDGGKLTIECRNAQLDHSYVARNPDATVGEYVALAVSDTGSGMPPDVQGRAFEPFFTTKEVGKGSGLGLSMVYGFAKQSGGHASIYSEEGRGSTVTIYLPRTRTGVPETRNTRPTPPKRGGPCVLAIEDNADVQRMVVAMLRSLGYGVISARDTAAARAILQDEQHVDLVLSDVVLPGGMSGPEFADEIRGARPDLPVVFMSGYSAEAAERNGFVDANAVFLNKPFQRDQLARALQEALEKA